MPERPRNLAAIAEKSDAILIDRGDLSREVPIEQIPAIQKLIIRKAKAHGAKVYVATNLLESMTSAPTPTRAEVNDVYNTLADGADGLVLAAETAIGQYPVNCARMVVKVVQQFQRNANGARADPRPPVVAVGRGRAAWRPAGLPRARSSRGCRTSGICRDHRRRRGIDRCRTDRPRHLLAAVRLHGQSMPGERARYNRLPSGLAWTMPIVLAVRQRPQAATRRAIASCSPANSGLPHSILDVSEVLCSFDPDRLARKWFGTDSREHPGVARVLSRGGHFLCRRHHPDPAAAAAIQALRSYACPACAPFLRTRAGAGWWRFHSRNLVHRAHEAIQIAALERTYADGLLINPVVGNAKRGDFVPHLILDGYQAMLDYGIYPPGKVVLASFITYPRFAGPREAVFTALCRKNMGCSHFIVGRDHSGVGGSTARMPAGSCSTSSAIWDRADLLRRHRLRYRSPSATVDLIACKTARPISGTEIRRALTAGEALPNWMMRSEVQDVVRAELMMKHAVFQE